MNQASVNEYTDILKQQTKERAQLKEMLVNLEHKENPQV